MRKKKTLLITLAVTALASALLLGGCQGSKEDPASESSGSEPSQVTESASDTAQATESTGSESKETQNSEESQKPEDQSKEEKGVFNDDKTKRKNPIFTSCFTADPAPLVVGDTLYVYTTHDENKLINDFYTMNEWLCFSTKDMVNWTNHGVVFSLKDIKWADDRAWAPQVVERNGKFYMYCPVHKKNGGMAIAVGTSDSPTGPFKDKLIPLIDEGDWNDIDPTVFVDDDGQAYLYFGNPELRYVLLKENMIAIDKETGVVKIPMTEESFGKGAQSTGTTYAEGPWFYKRNGIYYMVYAAFAEGQGNEHLAYSMADSPTGPWKYGGVIMTDKDGTFTIHPGVVDFKGHSYLFYHNAGLRGGNLFHRSVCVAEFQYNEDGTIPLIEKPVYIDMLQ